MAERLDCIRTVDDSRVEFSAGLETRDLEQLVNDRKVRVIQTSSPVPIPIWDALNEGFFSRRPDVELRVYGHYTEGCDLAFASRMTNVRRFAADSLMEARNVESLAHLNSLESLSIGIFEMQDLRVLELVDPALDALSIGATRSKKPDLAPLERFKALKKLHIEGHTKSIGVLSALCDLEDLTLRSITTPDLEYLRPLDRLRSLDIKLGGIKSFTGIEEKATIKYLELWQIRGLSEINVVSSLVGLQNLFLQSLPRIEALPSLKESRALRRITLMNMKGLRDFTELERAPVLGEFALIEGNRQEPEQLIPVLQNPHLLRASAHFGSDRKNKRFSALRERYGKADFDSFSEFKYL